MFHTKQFGFRSKRRTIDALAEKTEQIKYQRTGTFTGLLLDWRERIDSIDHEVFFT